jgi:NodT family efflux transporter outer membrane factor (OMF) lipoprotein
MKTGGRASDWAPREKVFWLFFSKKNILLSSILSLNACITVGPDYTKPDAPTPVAYKELAGWKPATPIDDIDKGAWWSVYKDPLLDRLEREVDVSNQTIKEYLASYQTAQALVQEARANLFPTLSVSPGVTRQSSGSGSSSSSLSASGLRFGGSTTTNYSVEPSASWTIDVWGRIRRGIESDVASAQASAADIANARLSAQGALATDYFYLRGADAQSKLLSDTVRDYQRSLDITKNQYTVGVAARSDVITAQVQLDTAQAELVNTGVARATYEHAIAVLTGHPPAELTIPPGPLAAQIPVVPASIPSTLLERRPDVAAEERLMQAENALIGVQIASYYPDVSLSALYGYSGNPLGSLIQTSNRVWSLGASAAETIFEGGTRSASVSAARASYDQAVATYRQTVLTAFQQVEDELSTLRILQQQAIIEDAAVTDSRRAVEIAINEYRAGTQAYTTVVTAENTALSNEQTALTVQQNRLIASVALIQALGGGWDTKQIPEKDDLQRGLPFLPDALDPTLKN